MRFLHAWFQAHPNYSFLKPLSTIIFFASFLNYPGESFVFDPNDVERSSILNSDEVLIDGKALRLQDKSNFFHQTTLVNKSSNFKEEKVAPGSHLYFSYAIKPKGWSYQDATYIFKVQVKLENSETIEIFQDSIVPKTKTEHNGWISEKIDLDKFSGRTIQISFEKSATPAPDRSISNQDLLNEMIWGDFAIDQFQRKKDEFNVIIISLDTLRSDRLGVSGYFRNTSPHIDNMAKKGVSFTQAISNSPWTAPAHMSLFTGLTPSHHGIGFRNWKEIPVSMASHIPTLADYFQQKGYLTHAITGSGSVSANYGFYRGFYEYLEYVNQSGKKERDISSIFNKGIEWIKENQKLKFFLFLHSYEIHGPFIHDSFSVEDYSQVTNQLSEVQKILNSKYDSGILYADQFIGKLFASLRTIGLLNKTIVILVSDHGEEMGEHGSLAMHGHTLYEEVLRIPFIFYAPKIFPAQEVNHRQVQLVDVMPTLFEYFGDPNKIKNTDGQSLLPLLSGRGDIPHRYAFSEALSTRPEQKSIRSFKDGPQKIIWTMSSPIGLPPLSSRFKKFKKTFHMTDTKTKKTIENNGLELYNLSQDPAETKNIFQLEENSELFNTLQEYTDNPPIESDQKEVIMDEDLKEKLKSLGYL